MREMREAAQPRGEGPLEGGPARHAIKALKTSTEKY